MAECWLFSKVGELELADKPQVSYDLKRRLSNEQRGKEDCLSLTRKNLKRSYFGEYRG